MTDKELIEKCLEFSQDDLFVDWFDPTFIESVFASNKFNTDDPTPLTKGQRSALENILDMFKRKVENHV
jgi:hypothetical protein